MSCVYLRKATAGHKSRIVEACEEGNKAIITDAFGKINMFLSHQKFDGIERIFVL
jgi:hypothetical protein